MEELTLLDSIILGAIQGVSEFLPVSSSGHLVVARKFLHIKQVTSLYDVILHVATLFVVMVMFHKTIWRLLKVVGKLCVGKIQAQDIPDLRFIVSIIIASVVTVPFGVIISRIQVQNHPRTVCILFIVTGLLLIIASFYRGNRDYEDLKLSDGFVIGLYQGLGVLPGISRSGATISGCLMLRMERKEAGEYSFILSIPAIVGALIFEMRNVDTLTQTIPPIVLAVGVLSAIIVGFASLAILMKMIRHGKLHYFAAYLIPLGLIGIFLV